MISGAVEVNRIEYTPGGRELFQERRADLIDRYRLRKIHALDSQLARVD